MLNESGKLKKNICLIAVLFNIIEKVQQINIFLYELLELQNSTLVELKYSL